MNEDFQKYTVLQKIEFWIAAFTIQYNTIKATTY